MGMIENKMNLIDEFATDPIEVKYDFLRLRQFNWKGLTSRENRTYE